MSRWDARNEDRANSSEYDYLSFGSEFRVFVENRLALNANVRLSTTHQRLTQEQPEPWGDYNRSYEWSFGVGLEYQIDNLLY